MPLSAVRSSRRADPAGLTSSPPEPVRPPRTMLVLVGAGLFAAAASRAGLAWDGAYYLLSTLHRQRPFVAHHRVLAALPQWPVVWLSRVTDNTTVLAVAFGMAYALLPLLALSMVWWMARRTTPRLFTIAALGITLATLPGQFFLVSEAVLAVQLSWPLLVWAAGGAPARLLPVALVPVAALVVVHPFAAPLLLLVAAVALVCAPRGRYRCLLAAALLVVAVLRLAAVGVSGYEERSTSLAVVVWHFGNAVAGLPLVALLAAALAGCALVARVARRRALLDRAALLAVVVAGVALLAWAAVPGRWSNALDYRTWTLFTALPFVALLVIDARCDPTAAAASAVRDRVGVAAAAVFAVVLAVQAVVWTDTLTRFTASVARSDGPCLATVPATGHTPLEHWGQRAASILVQGRSPRTVLLDDEDCAELGAATPLPLAPYEDTPRAGWLDLRLGDPPV